MFSGIIHPVDDILDVIISLSALGFVISYSYAQWKSGTTKANTETVVAYKNELEAIRQTLVRIQADNKTKDAQIASLQGQIDTLKEIPLTNISSALCEISESNKRILARLNSDATILAAEVK